MESGDEIDKSLAVYKDIECAVEVPVEVPDKICGCSPESMRVSPGKTVAGITMNDLQCGPSEEGLKGLQSIIHRKQRKIRDTRVQARDSYLHDLLMIITVPRNIVYLQ
ncbi:hypothetical protein C0J45_18434 [Silurus meridionalis]|nr:hypothetical protein C0J45_18434 [Silurus meridionalis]